MRVGHSPIRSPTRVAVDQALAPVHAIARDESLRLSIAHPEQWRRLAHTQFPRDYAPQHGGTNELPITHRCPLHARSPCRKPESRGDTSIGDLRGQYHWCTTSWPASYTAPILSTT